MCKSKLSVWRHKVPSQVSWAATTNLHQNTFRNLKVTNTYMIFLIATLSWWWLLWGLVSLKSWDLKYYHTEPVCLYFIASTEWTQNNAFHHGPPCQRSRLTFILVAEISNKDLIVFFQTLNWTWPGRVSRTISVRTSMLIKWTRAERALEDTGV